MAWRWSLGLFYLAAGIFHLARPEPFLTIMPGFVPWPDHVVALTGIAEIAGALGLMQAHSARLRRAAGVGLALYALCVWPANFNHMLIDLEHTGEGLPLAYHVPRLMLQPIIIWLALWTGETTDWPMHRSGS